MSQKVSLPRRHTDTARQAGAGSGKVGSGEGVALTLRCTLAVVNVGSAVNETLIWDVVRSVLALSELSTLKGGNSVSVQPYTDRARLRRAEIWYKRTQHATHL